MTIVATSQRHRTKAFRSPSLQQSIVTNPPPGVSRNQLDDQKDLTAVGSMDAVQVAGFVLQIMRFGPDMQDTGEWYRGAWETFRAFFRRNRESNASMAYIV